MIKVFKKLLSSMWLRAVGYVCLGAVLIVLIVAHLFHWSPDTTLEALVMVILASVIALSLGP